MTVAVVAHRGDSTRFRENTLPAFESAVRLGATHVELDVRTTADGECVVLHDETLLRLWGLPEPVAEVTLDRVRELGYADIRIPLLREVLELLDGSGTGVLVDVVDPRDAEVAQQVVAAHAPGDLEVVWCGPVEAVRRVRELDPDAVVHLNLAGPSIDPGLVDELRPAYANLEAILLSPGLVADAHARGLLVSAWTVDRPDDMAAVVRLGADSVTTNRPLVLQSVLAALASDGSAEPRGERPVPSREEVVAGDLARWAVGWVRETPVAEVTTKTHAADLVTPLDLAVEQRVRAVLAAEFPDHVVVGEEEGGTEVAGRPTWWLDPVDGTTNLASGLPWSSFSLALAHGSDLRVGAIGDPWRSEVAIAVRGGGVVVGGVRRSARREGSLAGGTVLLELASHEPWPGMHTLLDALAGAHATARIMGSGALSVASVGLGRCLGAVISAWSPVDHAAALLVALEGGAVVLDATGSPTTWPVPGPFVVAAPGVADELHALVESAQAFGEREVV
jgi:myo-inositol-1(or 4)-monophosphatase/deoxyribonuclease-2